MKHFRTWERKYGKAAKHIVKQREEETKKPKEEKRRQREAAARRPHCVVKRAFESPKPTDSGYGGRIGAKSGGGGEGGRADGQPPSKKRMKEKESTAMPPVGKRSYSRFLLFTFIVCALIAFHIAAVQTVRG